MLVQTCGLSSQCVYRRLNASLSLHNLSKLLLKKLNSMSGLFYAARSHMRLETRKNETVSGSKVSALACVMGLARDEFWPAGYGRARAHPSVLLPARRKGNGEIVEGGLYPWKPVITLERSRMLAAPVWTVGKRLSASK